MNNELDDMKNLWQGSPAPQNLLSAQDIERMLTKRSQNALQSIRNSILLELVIAVILCLWLLYAAIQANSFAERFAMLQLAFLISPCFIFYVLALKNLHKGISLRGSLHDMLKESVQFWQTALRVYFWGGVLLLPVVFMAMLGWRQQLYGLDNALFFTGNPMQMLLKALISWVVISAIVWGMIRVSYGKYVNKLKQCLAEMERAE